MATKVKSDIPSSPPNDESDADADEEETVEEETVDNDSKPPVQSQNVADILKRLQSSGALLKKPKVEYHCYTCQEDFLDSEELQNHLLQHVSLPSVVISKLPSDDEDGPPSGDDWTDEEEEAIPAQPAQKTPQKIDISQLMKKGISIKKPETIVSPNSDSALSKLSGLGFTIKKNSTPIKQEQPDPVKQEPSDLMQKLGKLGGIKLKLKSDGNNSNSFKVVNGLKDFKTSDDEEEQDGLQEQGGESGDEHDASNEANEDEESAHSSHDVPEINKQSEDEIDEEEIPLSCRKIANVIKDAVKPQHTKSNSSESNAESASSPMKIAPKPPGRPAIKQTPLRKVPVAIQQQPPRQTQSPSQGKDISTTSSTPERRESQGSNMENVVVKKEVDTGNYTQTNTSQIFSNQIKTERSSPPPQYADTISTSTPIISKVKTESDASAVSVGYQPPLFQNKITTEGESNTLPLIEPKKETSSVTIIEINGDSNDEDDDCCVVSATPAPDVKPVIPKAETVTTSYPTPVFHSSQPSYSTPSVLSSRLTASTEKQHSFNWNAPDSKSSIDFIDRSADDIFESLLSAKKENSSLLDASEYISLDTLGPQHSCEVCNTRFTSISLLDDHRRMTGHSSSLVAPTSSTLLPYSQPSNILSNLLPVKQLAEQVGKLTSMGGSGPGFTHQQNVMINIQAYPGAGGVMGPPPSYNNYPQGQPTMHPGFQQAQNMYGVPGQQMPGQMPGQQMPNQYLGQNYMGQQNMGQYGQQYQPPMSKAGYPGQPPTSPYSTASPLQSMQQAVYGQSPGLMNNQMGPPGSSPNHPYVAASSPSGGMKMPTSSGVRIHNVQTFQPGQILTNAGQQMSGDMGPGQAGPQMTAPGQPQMPAPGPIRMAAGANIAGTRPRMPSVRGARPSIRPGIQVHGQVRGAKPRMPMKRPAGMAGGPGIKRRPDMLLPGKHDNEDCQVMSMQKQREGLPMIQSVQGAKDKLNLGSQISITKKTVNKEANAMANVLASRGISVKQKQKSRSPTPERPVPHIPNLGAGVSIKHTSKSSNFSIPEAKVGGGMQACKICKKMFMNSNSLAVHMSNAHPHAKINMFKCEECPASYPKSLQLQHHKRVFHNATGPNRELGLPVVDLSQEDNVKRLSSLGIYSFIPLANREQASGVFGIPIISVHNMQNGMTNGLDALGADGLLSLGPLKPLPNT